ncbi:MAG: long-chain-fatty-acid--CoA ligase [Alphaproteobacteria bacterium]
MHGLMMDEPLMISSLIEFAADNYADIEVISRVGEGKPVRTTYGAVRNRARRLAKILQDLGIGPGDRVATLAWNDHRHMELYYAVSGIGAVLHTINPRLFPEQVRYIVNHAADRIVFADPGFVPMLEALAPQLSSVEQYIVLADRLASPAPKLTNAAGYEDLLAGEQSGVEWPSFDERTASSLCYSSGTTGDPKGVLYSHRATVLHTLNCISGDLLGLSRKDTVLAIVPMAHANGWALPYAGPLTGAKLVLPGAKLDGASIYELIETEQVTFAPGVPTVFAMLLDHVQRNGKKFSSLQRIAVGGSAPPLSMLRAFEADFGVEVLQAWGLTESSNFGTLGRLKPAMTGLPAAQRYAIQQKQGLGVYGLRMKIVGDDGAAVPKDGVSRGRLMVRGPWVASGYFKAAGKKLLTDDGWLETGDIATIDADGYLNVVDRAKDLVKSGGEWISSVELENIALGHPDIAEACVIATKHPKWVERPLLLYVAKLGATVSSDSVLAFFDGKIAKWCVPDAAIAVDRLPRTATGKLAKAQLREQYAGATGATGATGAAGATGATEAGGAAGGSRA